MRSHTHKLERFYQTNTQRFYGRSGRLLTMGTLVIVTDDNDNVVSYEVCNTRNKAKNRSNSLNSQFSTTQKLKTPTFRNIRGRGSI
jgi:hypothetical protein